MANALWPGPMAASTLFDAAVQRGRFAPSLSGMPHEGTWLNALLCWLDARAHGAQIYLRYDNLDALRAQPSFRGALERGLGILGLEPDGVVVQSDGATGHAEALDSLASSGRLYACHCSRARLRTLPRRPSDNSPIYDNRCRPPQRTPYAARQGSALPLRAYVGDAADGDPVVRRADGVVGFLLASVVDDARMAVTRVVRGHDLAPYEPVQRALASAIGLPWMQVRHHLLLRASDGKKLSKSGPDAAGLRTVSASGGAEVLGWLAARAGLLDAPRPTHLDELVLRFRWDRIYTQDSVVAPPERWRFAGEAQMPAPGA